MDKARQETTLRARALRMFALLGCALAALAPGSAEQVRVASEGGDTGSSTAMDESYVTAEGRLKISPDLLSMISGSDTTQTLAPAPEGESSTLLRIIASYRDGSVAGDLAAALGGQLVDDLDALGIALIDVTDADLEAALQAEAPQGLVYMVPNRTLERAAFTDGFDQTFSGGSTRFDLPPSSHVRITSGAQSAAFSTDALGSGVTIAVIDSGIDAGHPDLLDEQGLSRVLGRVDFTDGGETLLDPFGHGTHVAGLAAGNGAALDGATTTYAGTAPEAGLVDLRVLNAEGSGEVDDLLQALQWILDNHALYGIRVVNLSLGTAPRESHESDPLCVAVERLVDEGLSVVVAAGNYGKNDAGDKLYGGILSPANAPRVITVGAANTFQTDARSDDGVTTYSSRGPTRSYLEQDLDGDGTFSPEERNYDHLFKPDLIAPGNRIVSTAAQGSLVYKEYPELVVDELYMEMSGTSMAAPLVSGIVATLYERRPGLTPELAKSVLMATAQRLDEPGVLEQGAGLVNAYAAHGLLGQIVSLPATLVAGESATPGYDLRAERSVTIAGESVPVDLSTLYVDGWYLGDEIYRSAGILWQGLGLAGDGVLYGKSLDDYPGITWSDGIIWADSAEGPEDLLLEEQRLGPDGVLFADGIIWADGFYGIIWADTLEGIIWADSSVFADGVLWPDATSGIIWADGYFGIIWADATEGIIWAD